MPNKYIPKKKKSKPKKTPFTVRSWQAMSQIMVPAWLQDLTSDMKGPSIKQGCGGLFSFKQFAQGQAAINIASEQARVCDKYNFNLKTRYLFAPVVTLDGVLKDKCNLDIRSDAGGWEFELSMVEN